MKIPDSVRIGGTVQRRLPHEIPPSIRYLSIISNAFGHRASTSPIILSIVLALGFPFPFLYR